ncbi:cell division protein FtsW [Bacteroides zoogleoformans]|uniref:Probable peptidoglycan glycosyltransferase FtsW n=1 Tax=Bacteroides zoogleoformans TaxID=28119 RepID=A0ABN5IIY3_9BACE|nr:FtsW/RodA/SpoVE family cell cycle protein [Bacteroides zoogleoformans]AVM52749.1 rod shape-determining protein RodA [Bacteroides zoogleoformans]TWJ16661.1 cell division protein FtsW [Bacteroides zoogleoformans]
MDLLRSIFKGDKVIWIIFLFLCLISIIEVFSAASTLTYKSGDHWGPITQHSILLMVGAVIVVLVHNIPYKWFQAFPVFLLPVSIGLLAFVMLMGFITGDRVNGAARWMTFMGIQFQPSEIAKMAVVIVTAFILSRGQNENGASPRAFKRIMIVTCLVCGLILPENYSTGMLLFGTVYLMMFIGRVPAKKLVILGGGLLAFGALFITFLLATPNDTLKKIPMGHRLTTVKSRIADFTGKEEIPAAKFDIDGDGQVAHARIAVATSNVVGKGPGNSVQRDFLSQAFSDFIYAIIIEELGLLGGGFVVFLYVCLLVRVGRIAKKCDRTFPAFLIMGIALLLVTQALFNMMVAVGLAPVTGQPLPLISKGGTSTFINCAYIGMILSVSRYTAKLEEQRLHDAQIPLLVDAGGAEEQESSAISDAQTAADPTAEMLNSDAEFK